MRVLSLSLRNFKSYQEAEVDLGGVSLAAVVGPNGAGKSTLLEAVVFALTGARGLRNLDGFVRRGCDECRVSLTFAMGSECYRITRTRSLRGSGKSTVELARLENGLWVAEGTGARDTDERIARLLAVDEDTLLLTSIITQGDAGAFFNLRPAQRLEALSAILRLDERYGPLERYFKDRYESARAELGAVRRDVERLEADVATLTDRETDLARARQQLQEARTAAEKAEADHAEAAARLRELEEAERAAQQARQRLAELQERRDRLEARAATLAAEIADLDGRVAAKPELERALAEDLEPARAELARLEKEREADAAIAEQRARLESELTAIRAAATETVRQGKALAAEAARLRTDVGDLERRLEAIRTAEVPVCDRCGQPIADTALARTLAQLEAEAEQARARLQSAEEEVESLRCRLADLNGQSERLSDALGQLPAPRFDAGRYRAAKAQLERLESLPARLAEIAVLEERRLAALRELSAVQEELNDPVLARELAEAEAAAHEAEILTQAAHEARQAAEETEARLRSARADLAELERTCARHEEAVAILGPSRLQLSEARNRARELEVEQADAELLRRAFSKWGVPALVVENVLAALEVEVNELLSLYDGGLAVRFEGHRETREGLRDSLEILVHDGRDWRPFETFSGGERYRVASAMRLGLATLLAHRSGARVETLIVDEPEGLDAAGRQHLARILERMSERFGLVLLLTHYDDLKDAMPSQLVVSRNGDGTSRVEVLL